MQVDRPNWCDGFADFSLKDLSDAPEQWLGDVASYAPFLGVQGNILYDLSGYGHHGTLVNMSPSTAWVSGTRGTALAFDGLTNIVDCGVLSALSGATRASMTGWVYRGGSGDTVGFGQHLGGGKFSMLWYSDNRVYIGVENGADSYPSFAASELGWHFFGLSYDGSLSGLNRIAAYWDMVPQTLTAGNVDPSSSLVSGVSQSAFWLGADVTNAVTRYWGGQIDDVRVYNRSLSFAEILNVYADRFTRYRLRRRIWAVSFDAIDVSQFRRRPPR